MLLKLRVEPQGAGGPRRSAASTGSRDWPRRCAATRTRCTPSSASAKSRTTAAPRFVAFFEPDHHIVRREAGFFVRRFANMRWSILTPELSHPLGRRDAARRARARPAPTRREGDPVEETWKTYYASIFNPARVKVKAMLKEMPKKYWANMPETALVAPLLAGAQAREAAMIETSRSRRRCRRAGGNVASAAWEALRDEAARLHPLRPLQMRDPDGVRRRPARRANHVRRRAAGRPGGSRRAAVRRAGGAGVRRRAGGGRDRPRRRPTSPMRSSISNSCCAASGGIHQTPDAERDRAPAAGGSSRSAS